MEIKYILRRIWLISANKIKTSESVSKQSCNVAIKLQHRCAKKKTKTFVLEAKSVIVNNPLSYSNISQKSLQIEILSNHRVVMKRSHMVFKGFFSMTTLFDEIFKDLVFGFEVQYLL